MCHNVQWSFITHPGLDIIQENIMGEQIIVQQNVSCTVSGHKNWKEAKPASNQNAWKISGCHLIDYEGGMWSWECQ